MNKKAEGRGFESLSGLIVKLGRKVKSLKHLYNFMEILLALKKESYQKVREVLLKDEIVSRASIVFKDGSVLGKEGYYCYVSGTEEQCKRAIEMTKDLAEEVSGEEKKEVVNFIKAEENKANEGFGAIFG